MQEMFQGFISVDNIFWGDDVYRWWFYIAIVIIILFEKRRTTKITYAWYSIVFMIGIFNPVSYWIMSIIAPTWPYRARLYSMLPIPCVLALGSILLFDKVCGLHKKSELLIESKNNKRLPAVKLVMVGGLCILIVMGGTDVYHQDWMKPAQNLEKVPQAALELKERLKEQKDICIAVPDSLSSYIRQIAPEFYTSYGRYVNGLGAELSQQNPDPMSVMIKAGEQSCDYIVVYDNEKNIENFENNGYDVYDRIKGYLVYKVSNVPFTERTFNKKHQVIGIMYLDENGIPVINHQGYAGIAYEYDSEGNQRKQIYLDDKGERVIISSGYSAILRTYTKFSHQVESMIFLDIYDNPIQINGRYELRYQYNNDRRLERESYYDEYGRPMNRTDLLFASRKITYDSQGRIIGEHYYNTEDEPVISYYGYASYTRELDINGNVIQETYYGTDDRPIRIGTGYAGVAREFTETGMKTRETYLDEEGEKTDCNSGYAQIYWEYNEKNQLIRETYWGKNGDPAIVNGIYHGIIRKYDEAGNVISEIYLDIEGDPI